MTRPFAAGEPCLLFDDKGRRYLLELRPRSEFHFHQGVLPHTAIIGSPEGVVLRSSRGARLVALRPRLADYVLKMGRRATVSYPKDAAEILVWADIGPGQTVLEAGTGSGGLTMVLARAVLPGGRVISVERRPDHQDRARTLMEGFFGSIPEHVTLIGGDVEPEIERHAPDRLVLDLPEPWHSVAPAAEHLPGGAVFCAYLPTVPQVEQLRAALDASDTFIDASTFEVLLRDWVIDGRSVRPGHRMVGHTGFITVARKYLAAEAVG